MMLLRDFFVAVLVFLIFPPPLVVTKNAPNSQQQNRWSSIVMNEQTTKSPRRNRIVRTGTAVAKSTSSLAENKQESKLVNETAVEASNSTTNSSPSPPEPPTTSMPLKSRPPSVTYVSANHTMMPVYLGPQKAGTAGVFKILPGRGMHHLLRKIFSTYDKEVMPARPVVIHMDVLMLKVKSTVEKEGIFESVIALFVEWNDARMSWKPSDYDNNVTILAFDSDKVWLPDIAMTNSADHLYSISRDSRFVVRVSHDGNFKYVPTGTARTWCELKLPTFPFDVQTCSLEFESWALDSTTMTFDGQSHLLIDDTFASQQWSLCSYKTVTYDHLYEFTGETFTRVRFDFTVKRKSMFYVLILIFPSTLLSLLQLLVFIIPSDNTTADRIGFGTTNLLTLVVFQTIVTEEMPKSSDAVTSLSKYIIALIIIAAVGICESVAVERVLRISYHPPPKMAMRIVRFSRSILVTLQTRYSVISQSDATSDKAKKRLLNNKGRISPISAKQTTVMSTGDTATKTVIGDCCSAVKNRTKTACKSASCFCIANKWAAKNSLLNDCDSYMYGGGKSNEDAIVDALKCNNCISSSISRRNSYFSALSRDRSTSFIVKLLKQQQQQQNNQSENKPSDMGVENEPANNIKKTAANSCATENCGRRKSSAMFTKGKQATMWAIMAMSKREQDEQIAAMRSLRERNLAQWAQMAQFLDLITLICCGFLALCIPVVLFLPLVYFDDRCKPSAGNTSHQQQGSAINLTLNISGEPF